MERRTTPQHEAIEPGRQADPVLPGEQARGCTAVAVAVIGWGHDGRALRLEARRLPRDPVPVDAIPDIGENQQIVFTEWMGRSPQDVEDQITYPLTVSLLGIPGVKTIRSYSLFGFSIDLRDLQGRRGVLLVAYPRAGKTQQLCRRARCRTGCSRRWGRTPPRWARSSGTRWKDATRRQPDRRLGSARTAHHPGLVRPLRPACRPRASPKSPRSAALCRNTRSTSIRTRCGPTASRSTRCSMRSGCPTSMSGARTIEINKVEYVIRGLGFIEDI